MTDARETLVFRSPLHSDLLFLRAAGGNLGHQPGMSTCQRRQVMPAWEWLCPPLEHKHQPKVHLVAHPVGSTSTSIKPLGEAGEKGPRGNTAAVMPLRNVSLSLSVHRSKVASRAKAR